MFDAVVGKIFEEGEDKIFLFFLDPEDNTIKDGLNIQDDSEVYQELGNDTLMVSEVVLKDGTKEVEIDLDDFIGGEYGKYDIFIHIKDLMPFKLGHRDDNKNLDELNYKTVIQVIEDGEFQSIAKECIEIVKNEVVLKKEKEVEKNV
jgi:hypothetical protein